MKFDRSLNASYPIVLHAFIGKYETPRAPGAMTGGGFYDTYMGAADGGVSYTVFHCVESIADARMPELNRFNKRYLCQVNSNLRFALPDDHPSFFGALSKDGIELARNVSSSNNRALVMKSSLWHNCKPALYFADGISQFRQHIINSKAGESLVELTQEY